MTEKLPRGFDLHEGEWIYVPRRATWLLACCDCSLVHSVERKTVNGKQYFRLEREEKETGLLRKAMKARKK
jgi:hypothetical protein